MVPVLYNVRMDIDPDDFGAVMAWVATRHAHDSLKAGFFSNHLYRSVLGSPLMCNLYEIPSPEIFSSEAFAQSRRSDPQAKEMMAKTKNVSAAAYQQCLVSPGGHDEGHDRPSRSISVTAPVILAFRFGGDDLSTDDLLEGYEKQEIPRLRSADGFLRARLCRQVWQNERAPSRQPEWLCVTEWSNLEAAKPFASLDDLIDRFRSAGVRNLRDAELNLAEQHLSFLNATAWAS